jgi:hypothetical protein
MDISDDGKATLTLIINGEQREYKLLITEFNIQKNQTYCEIWNFDKKIQMPGKLFTDISLKAVVSSDNQNIIQKQTEELKQFSLGLRKLDL